MPLYSFKGHYPVEQIDNNKGWYEVPAKPEATDGMETAWLNGEWVVRNVKPKDRVGYQWNWNHSERSWIECEYAVSLPEGVEPQPVITEPTASAVASDEFAITVDGAPI